MVRTGPKKREINNKKKPGHPLEMRKKYEINKTYTHRQWPVENRWSIGDNKKSLKNIIHKLWHISHINYLMINFWWPFFFFTLLIHVSCSLSRSFYAWRPVCRVFHLITTAQTFNSAIICGRQNYPTTKKLNRMNGVEYAPGITYIYV